MNLTVHTAPKMDRAPRYRHKVASFRKNSMERIDVELIEYNGTDLVHICVARDASGLHALNYMKGTARYVSVGVRLLPQLIAALQEAKARAVREGLLHPTPSANGGN